MQTEETAEEASLRQLLRQKLQGQVDLFNTEHLQILLDRGLNSEELLPTATWEDLVEDPALPEALLVQLLQAYNAGELLGFSKLPVHEQYCHLPIQHTVRHTVRLVAQAKGICSG